ncbi:MAG: DsbA family protein [Candidatus Marinimicrobia bacterium]|nr:DsbA family protein [Candidatus Neomarinimicrobiota bacterium]
MNKSKIPTVLAILLAGATIGGAIVYSKDSNNTTPSGTTENGEEISTPQTIWDIIEPVSEKDHVLGNPDAKITLVLYSDIECPYCKMFHGVLEQTIEKYGKNGTLRWVYRHLPMESLHPTAFKEAEATECAAELGGENMFWEYIKTLVESEKAPSQSNLVEDLSATAEKLGLDKEKFSTCLNEGRYTSRVEETMAEAEKIGIQGTPFSVVVREDGMAAPLSGALTYEQMEEVLTEILNPTEATEQPTESTE